MKNNKLLIPDEIYLANSNQKTNASLAEKPDEDIADSFTKYVRTDRQTPTPKDLEEALEDAINAVSALAPVPEYLIAARARWQKTLENCKTRNKPQQDKKKLMEALNIIYHQDSSDQAIVHIAYNLLFNHIYGLHNTNH